MSLATDAIYRKKFSKINAAIYTSINTHSYKVIMCIQRLRHVRNIHTTDDGLRLGRKKLGNN